jgi:hypothetical protein
MMTEYQRSDTKSRQISTELVFLAAEHRVQLVGGGGLVAKNSYFCKLQLSVIWQTWS